MGDEFGFFGNFFDMDGDGKLDGVEKAMDFAAFSSMMDSMETEDITDELEEAGLDADDLEFMDSDERREALEDAGLDPDDYE